MKKTYISNLKYAAAPLALGLAMIATPSFAQDKPADEASAEKSDAIVVTGSRIARPNIEAPSPVTVVGAEQIELTGTTTVETLLNELPQVIPGNTRVSNNSGGENFATLDLRGLGPGRTLILLDGERLPSSTTTGVTDVSQIPTGLINRVDVVTGGASAVYGSDAIAGVINFILKQDYQGVELTGLTTVSQDGTGFGFNMSGMMGGNFADDRGNLTIYGSFTNRDSVSQARYPYSAVSGAVFYDPTVDVGVGGPALVIDDPSKIPAGYVSLLGGGSATPPWGTITALAGNGFTNLSTLLPATFANANTDCNSATPGVNVNSGTLTFNANNQLEPNHGSGYCAVPIRANGSTRFNFGPLNYLVTPYNRLTLTALGHYDFSENTRLKTYMSFNNANQQVNLAPTPATGIVVPADSPFIPADLRIALNSRANPNGDFVINRRFSETGPRDGRFKTTAMNLRGVLEHDLSDTWKMSVVLGYGRVDNSIRAIGNINKTAVYQGLRGCKNSAGVVNGTGILPGCVSINIFGSNTLTPAMLSFVRVDTQEQEQFQQLRAAANITGSIGQLPGGPIGIAAGVEYRKDTGSTIVDDAQRTGNIYGFNAVQSVAGSINVSEIYGEVRLPILSMLSVGAGARYSNYSTAGGLFNWKAEAEFQPISMLKIRATFNKAARAPNVFELFQNGDQGFPSYVDPCNQSSTKFGTATANTALITQCLATGVPAGAISGFAQSNSQVQAFAFGNPNLKEEKAETYTVGAVLTPGNVFGGKLTATVDYYHIQIKNRVASLGASTFISRCYTGLDAAACARIVRDSGTGQINSINTTIDNANSTLETAGIDVGFDWSVDALGGRFSLSDVLTYVDTYNIDGQEYADTVFSGIGGVTPKWANAATLVYKQGGTTVQVRHVWKKGGKQNFSGAEFEGFFPDDARIPNLNLINLSLRQQIGDNFEITAICDNVLGTLPPQTVTGQQEQSNTNINFYDPYALGRTFTLQARIKF